MSIALERPTSSAPIPQDGYQDELRAMVIDDNPGDQYFIQRLLLRLGLEVIVADNGEDALVLARQERPDIVFVDVMLPGQDGYAIAARIRDLFREIYLPVVFITSLTDEEVVLKCFAAGGDDVLTKPVNEALLQAKIAAVLRTRRLHDLLGEQRDQLQQYRAAMEHDVGVAKTILENFSTRAELGVPNVRYELRPMETLNGDIIMAARRPDGAQCFIVGDFTGHGLPAAIGVLVVHDTFCSMVRKGLALDMVAQEINQKMFNLLPTNRFLSAALFEIDSHDGAAVVINAGLPDVLQVGRDGEIRERFASTYLPLGILGGEQFKVQALRTTLRAGDRVVAYSDGIVESTNASGAMFGMERLAQNLPGDGEDLVSKVLAAVDGFTGAQAQRDDVSLLSVTFDPSGDRPLKGCQSFGVRKPATDWRLSLRVEKQALMSVEPLVAVTTLAESLQGFGPRTRDIQQIVSELALALLDYGETGELPEEQRSFDIVFDHRATPYGGQLSIRVSNAMAGDLAVAGSEVGRLHSSDEIDALMARVSNLRTNVAGVEDAQCDPSNLTATALFGWFNSEAGDLPTS